jgi:hypothetical protein|tara:strand:+ start:1004 stop:1225 length:222 start_codon:yes stop_codon:yes gene_type:complete
MVMENNELDILYRKIEAITLGEDPLAAAGVMMAQALRIYKIMLTPQDFDNLTNHIINSKDDINVDQGPGPQLH